MDGRTDGRTGRCFCSPRGSSNLLTQGASSTRNHPIQWYPPFTRIFLQLISRKNNRCKQETYTDGVILLSLCHHVLLLVVIHPQVPGGISGGDFRGISGDFRGFPLHQGLSPPQENKTQKGISIATTPNSYNIRNWGMGEAGRCQGSGPRRVSSLEIYQGLFCGRRPCRVLRSLAVANLIKNDFPNRSVNFAPA